MCKRDKIDQLYLHICIYIICIYTSAKMLYKKFASRFLERCIFGYLIFIVTIEPIACHSLGTGALVASNGILAPCWRMTGIVSCFAFIDIYALLKIISNELQKYVLPVTSHYLIQFGPVLNRKLRVKLEMINTENEN